MAIVTGDVIKVVAHMLWENREKLANVFHINILDDGGAGVAVILNAILDVLDSVYAAMESDMANEVTADSVEFYNMTEDIPLRTDAWPTFTGGTATGDAMPPGTAGLVTFPTSAKRTFGRKFLPGLMEADQDAGVLGSSYMTSLAAFGAAFLDPVTWDQGGEAVFGVYSEEKGRFVWFNEALVRSIVAYQRRRKQGVGE